MLWQELLRAQLLSELQNVGTNLFSGALSIIYAHFIKIYIPETGGWGGGGGEKGP